MMRVVEMENEILKNQEDSGIYKRLESRADRGERMVPQQERPYTNGNSLQATGQQSEKEKQSKGHEHES